MGSPMNGDQIAILERCPQFRQPFGAGEIGSSTNWKIDAKFVEAARYFGEQELEIKNIQALPDYSKFINLTFNKDIAQDVAAPEAD